MQIEVGKMMNLHPSIEGWPESRTMPGTIIFVHPKGRFYVAEFRFAEKNFTLREAYPMPREWAENAIPREYRKRGYHRK